MVDYKILELSEGRHLCAICRYCPDGFDSTQDCHPCTAFDDCYIMKQSVTTEDNGMGYWVVSCPKYKREFINYKDYISSDLWQEKRLNRLRIDDYKCVKCGSAINVAVHHISYERIPFEPIEDLVTLCRSCHALQHEVDTYRKSKQQKTKIEIKRNAELDSIAQYYELWKMTN